MEASGRKGDRVPACQRLAGPGRLRQCENHVPSENWLSCLTSLTSLALLSVLQAESKDLEFSLETVVGLLLAM